LPVQAADGHDGGDGERNALVGRSEQHVKICPVVVVNRAGVKLAQKPQFLCYFRPQKTEKNKRLSSSVIVCLKKA
ncbi:MAG: hypothetical protein IIY78_07225, partial [Clostridia bacterium]|nr:hypothetical protein [Clostridia bacterium]